MKLEGTFAPTRKQDGPVGGGAASTFVALPGQETTDKKVEAETAPSNEKVIAGMKRGRDEDDEGAKEGEGRGSEGPAGGVRRQVEKEEVKPQQQQEEEDEDEGEEMEMDEDDD